MTEIKVYWCGRCTERGKDFKSTRKEIRKHLRERHGIKGMSLVKDEGSSVSASTKSEVFK